MAARQDIRSHAENFLMKHGFDTPPLAAEEALAAQGLEVAQLSLDDLLVNADLSPSDQSKIQAMLDAEERLVVFREGLSVQKRSWGSLHEIGHDFLPWHRDLLYYCPLLSLPPNLIDQIEAEADIFAAEAFFFGEHFGRHAEAGDLGLVTAIELAENVYGTSLHATFAHYVQESEVPCCLMVWKPINQIGSIWTRRALKLHYYVKSERFRSHIPPGQLADPDDVIAKVFTDSSMQGVVKHDMQFLTDKGKAFIATAESFSNSYNVFTLVTDAKPKPVV